MEKYTVRCITIEFIEDPQQGLSKDVETGTQPSHDANESEEARFPRQISANPGSLFNVANYIGCAVSIVLLVLSLYWGDGMSFIATLLLSALSSLAGLVNKCNIDPQKRNQKRSVPIGDVVVRYPNGSMVVVKCHENVARELFFAPEVIKYFVEEAWICRLISLSGTLMLMGGVICLASSEKKSQIAWAVSYILINILYWLAAALPPRHHWNTSRYNTVEHSISTGHRCDDYTTALWKAMCAAKCPKKDEQVEDMSEEIDHWAKISGALPRSEAWEKWLTSAKEKADEARFGPESGSMKKYDYNWDRARDCIIVPDFDPVAKWNELTGIEIQDRT